MKKILAVVLVPALLLGVLSVAMAATQSVPIDSFVSYAASQVGQNGSHFGFGSSNWCVRFINYCAKNNGGADLSGLFTDTGSVTETARHFAGLGRYYYFDDPYIPDGSDARRWGTPIPMNADKIERGDLAYFISNSSGGFEHIGIVETVNSNGVTIVHGSWSNKVARTNVTFGQTIGSNYPVRFAGIAKPDYASVSPSGPTVSAKSELLLLPGSEPGEHREPGEPFYFRGRASSNYIITSSTVQVRADDNMTVLMEKTVTPNKYEIDVLSDGLDTLKFGTLEEGNYYFWWLVLDASGTLKSWTVHFSVGDPDAKLESTPEPAQTLSPQPSVAPTLPLGSTVEPAPTPTPKPALSSALNDPSNGQMEDASGMDHFVAVNRYESGQFRDVARGDWFYSNVATAYRLGLMNGTGAGVFAPGNNMTLAEVVTLAARIHSIYNTGSDRFPTYDGGNWYDPYVNYARDNGIVTENYTYAHPATREQVVHILARALPEEELDSVAGRVSFADSGDITYMSDVRLLSDAGVINGIQEDDVTYFKPLEPITRAEVAAIVGRMVQPDTRVG